MAYSFFNPSSQDLIKMTREQSDKVKAQKIGAGEPTQDLKSMDENYRTPYEIAAGVKPQKYQGIMSDQGGLLSQYKLDPYGGEALQSLKGQAFAQGPSAWAQMQTQQQQLEQQGAADTATKRANQANAAAMSSMARQGGMGGGASALLARQGMRDQLGAQQDISRQGVMQRLGIGQQDIERKNQLLSKFGDLETQAQSGNIQNMIGDITKRTAFDTNRYNQQMAAWGAKETAAGMRNSGGGGKK